MARLDLATASDPSNGCSTLEFKTLVFRSIFEDPVKILTIILAFIMIATLFAMTVFVFYHSMRRPAEYPVEPLVEAAGKPETLRSSPQSDKADEIKMEMEKSILTGNEKGHAHTVSAKEDHNDSDNDSSTSLSPSRKAHDQRMKDFRETSERFFQAFNHMVDAEKKIK
ncbi:MAG: hypothetical protein Q9170_008273 [Blastenia crenularia]